MAQQESVNRIVEIRMENYQGGIIRKDSTIT
jgi:hypothetical protein